MVHCVDMFSSSSYDIDISVLKQNQKRMVSNIHNNPYRNSTCNFTYKNISFVNYFNSIMCEMKISNVKFIFGCECSVSYLKFPFRTRRFQMWNFEPAHFTYELGISYAKTLPFHVWNENLINENLPIPYVFHMWNSIRKLYVSSLWNSKVIPVKTDLLMTVLVSAYCRSSNPELVHLDT